MGRLVRWPRTTRSTTWPWLSGPEEVDAAVAALRSNPLGTEAVAIGEIRADPAGLVVLVTPLGVLVSSTCWWGTRCPASAGGRSPARCFGAVPPSNRSTAGPAG